VQVLESEGHTVFNRRRYFIGPCLVWWLVAGTARIACAQAGVILGTVRDSADARPVGSALVVLVGTTKESLSNKAGAFEIGGVGSGVHRLRAHRLGYVSGETTAVLRRNGDTVRVEINIRKVPGAIIALDPQPVLTACGSGRSRAAEWIASLDSGHRRAMGVEQDGDLRSLENSQLCTLLFASAVQYIVSHRLADAWFEGDSASLDWSLVLALMLRVGATAVLDFAAYQPSMYGNPDPDTPEPSGRRLFVTMDLATLRVIGAEVYPP